MEQAWVAKCAGCGLFCVLYEEVEFVCGKCHGEIQPGPQLSIAVSAALDTLFDANLPTEAVLAALWEQRHSHDEEGSVLGRSAMDLTDPDNL